MSVEQQKGRVSGAGAIYVLALAPADLDELS